MIGAVVYNDKLFETHWSTKKSYPILIIYLIRIMVNRHWDIILMVVVFGALITFSAFYNFEMISNEIYYVAPPILSAVIYMRLAPKQGEDTRHNILRLLRPEILEELLEDWQNERKERDEYKLGKSLECQLTAVHSDYLHCGVGTALKKHMIEFAKQNGFKYIISEATSDFSQGQNKKIGFEVKNEIYYETFECPKRSGKFPYRIVAKQTGFMKLCLMVHSVKKDTN